MSEGEFLFLFYSDKKQQFFPSSHAKDISRLLRNREIKRVEEELSLMDVDGVLVLDRLNKRWLLIYGSHTGLVMQRRMRRQAENIARSGYNDLEKGIQVPSGFPLEEASEADIGDLWQSVQMKYVNTDLKGAKVEPPGNPSEDRGKDEDFSLDSLPEPDP